MTLVGFFVDSDELYVGPQVLQLILGSCEVVGWHFVLGHVLGFVLVQWCTVSYDDVNGDVFLFIDVRQTLLNH